MCICLWNATCASVQCRTQFTLQCKGHLSTLQCIFSELPCSMFIKINSKCEYKDKYKHKYKYKYKIYANAFSVVLSRLGPQLFKARLSRARMSGARVSGAHLPKTLFSDVPCAVYIKMYSLCCLQISELGFNASTSWSLLHWVEMHFSKVEDSAASSKWKKRKVYTRQWIFDIHCNGSVLHKMQWVDWGPCCHLQIPG